MVILDLDGVIADTQGFVCKRVGIQLEDINRYNVSDTGLSDLHKKEVIRLFGDGSIYEHIEMLDGVKEFVSLCVFRKVPMRVYSLSYNAGVALAKQRWLEEKFGEELMSLKIVYDSVVATKKPDLHEVYDVNQIELAAEDNIEYMSKQVCKGKVIINRPWNKKEYYGLCGDTSIECVDSLVESKWAL